MDKIARAFIAIALNKTLYKELAVLQQKLKASNADVKWVAPENIHITLKFLGNITDEQIETVKDALKKSCAQFKSYDTSLKGIGAFPDFLSPRVIWVGMDEGSKQTSLICDSIEENLAKAGFPKEERKFSAHLTLGRVRPSAGSGQGSFKNKQKLAEVIEKEKSFYSSEKLSVQEIILFKSTLTGSGSIYEPILKTTLVKI